MAYALMNHKVSERLSICLYIDLGLSQLCSCPLPEGYIDETLKTIDLLIPTSNANCNRLVNKELGLGKLDKKFVLRREPPNVDRSEYGFWQERLADIDEAFERARPRSPVQWLYDTRDMERWWGFWLIAVGIFLTVLFGLIQSVTGILQVSRSG